MSGNDTPPRNKRKIRLIFIVAILLIVYGIAIQITRINLAEPLEPKRQENLLGLFRDLGRPDFFNYSNVTRSTNATIRMPCPEHIQGSEVSFEDRILLLLPNCVSTTQDKVTIQGEGFAEHVQGIIRWYPEDTPTTRVVSEFRTNIEGEFTATFTMPDVRESQEPQRLEVVERIDRTITGFSETTQETLSSIIETILMALMASTLGTILAVPISFLGARNLMSGVGAPLAAIMAAIIATPIGAGIGWLITAQLVNLSEQLADTVVTGLIALVIIAVLIWILLFVGPSIIVDEKEPLGARFLAGVRFALILPLSIVGLAILGKFGIVAGEWLKVNLHITTIFGIDFFGFIGEFVGVISGLAIMLMALMVGFLSALILASFASRYGQEAVLHLSDEAARILTAVLTLLGTAILLFGLLSAINWICLLGVCRQLPEDPTRLLVTISIICGVGIGILSLFAHPKQLFPVGMVTYMITRTILNGLRAIEPLVMGFVLVVWVGIGPFAGVLALMLHSIADLGKLFSEQVENIDDGPVEAVTATGANKIQTIVYAVIPQVVPHYTAFIFYRWDINVRLSTIIGFVGGGGIGLILLRSTNLLQYQKVAVMIIAIAVVVTLLDFTSSRIRKRIT